MPLHAEDIVIVGSGEHLPLLAFVPFKKLRFVLKGGY